MNWTLVYTKQATLDAKKLSARRLKPRIQAVLNILEKNPFTKNPPYTDLVWDQQGATLRQIDDQFCMIYEGCKKQKTVKIIRLCTF